MTKEEAYQKSVEFEQKEPLLPNGIFFNYHHHSANVITEERYKELQTAKLMEFLHNEVLTQLNNLELKEFQDKITISQFDPLQTDMIMLAETNRVKAAWINPGDDYDSDDLRDKNLLSFDILIKRDDNSWDVAPNATIPTNMLANENTKILAAALSIIARTYENEINNIANTKCINSLVKKIGKKLSRINADNIIAEQNKLNDSNKTSNKKTILDNINNKIQSNASDTISYAKQEYPEIIATATTKLLYSQNYTTSEVAKLLLTSHTSAETAKALANLAPERPSRSNDAKKWATSIVKSAQKSITPQDKSTSHSI
jgi:hypothetical protein